MDEKPKPCPPADAALLDDPESAETVLKSITPAEVIEVPWTLACFTATSCVTPVDDPLDALCRVEQELSSSGVRSTSTQASTIDLTKLQ